MGRGPRKIDDPWGAVAEMPMPQERSSLAGRLSRGRVKKGELDAAIAYYEEAVAPLLSSDREIIDLRLVIDRPRSTFTTLSTWESDDAFDRVAKGTEYQAALKTFAEKFVDVSAAPPESDDVRVIPINKGD